MWLVILLRAAGAISSERDRQTLDSLLTCTLSNRDILSAKWLGSVLCVRKTWYLLGPIWALALLTGGIHPGALPLLLLGWLAYAAFAAVLGLWCSLLCRNTFRATLSALVTAGLMMAGPWGLLSFVLLIVFQGPLPAELKWIRELEVYALMPPITFGTLAFGWGDQERLAGCAVLGVLLYGAVAAGLWGLLLACFGRVTGRMPYGTQKRVQETKRGERKLQPVSTEY
jgi:ABC-type transport system involved in multi-copper enzyme maturation permease subunit